MVRVTDPNSMWGRVTNYFGLNTAPKLILLDVGMTAELDPSDSENLLQFFKVLPESTPHDLTAASLLDCDRKAMNCRAGCVRRVSTTVFKTYRTAIAN